MKISVIVSVSVGLLAATALSGCAADEAESGASEAEHHAVAWTLASIPASVGSVTVVKDAAGRPILGPNGKATVYATARQATPGDPSIYRSTDSGRTFVPVTGATFPTPGFVVAAPSNPNILYAGQGPACMAGFPPELRRSADGGRTWVEVAGGVADLDVNPTNPDHLVGVTCSGVVKSTDGGRSWREIHSDGLGDGSGFTRGVNDRTTLYATFHSEGGSWWIHRSTDDGRTWQMPPVHGQSLRSLEVDPLDAKHIYTVSWEGFASSANGGDTLNSHNDGLETAKGEHGFALSNVVLDHVSRPPPGATATLYIGSAGQWRDHAGAGVFRWDGVDHWTKFAAAPGGEGVGQLAVVEVPGDPVLLAVTVNDYETPGVGGHVYLREIR